MDCDLFVIMRDRVRVSCHCNQQAPSSAAVVIAILGATQKQFFLSASFNDAASSYRPYTNDDG